MPFVYEKIDVYYTVKVCGANEVDIRNQRFRLGKNRIILVKMA